MVSLLLALIYAAFISLGLPDSLLGSAWPVMQGQLGVPLSYAGGLSMIISGGTILSSLLSARLTSRFGAGLVTTVSVLATAIALFGFSVSGSFWMLCLWAVPFGLGAGAVDAALNNYVAVHYASRHMNWLHCCWGIGAAVSPYIMGQCLTNGLGWGAGYRTVSFIQFGLTAILLISLPLWKGQKRSDVSPSSALPLKRIFAIKGVKPVLIAFFAYCAVEGTAGLWASSYLVLNKGIHPETAAKYASFFYLGITAGRFVSGFVADRLGDRRMIRMGIALVFAGILAVWLPAGASALPGLVVVGVGCAPIYPAIIHATPSNFGAQNSQAIVGVQMACAYTGSALMPPLFGWLAGAFSVGLLPLFLLVFALLMLGMTERLNRTVPAS